MTLGIWTGAYESEEMPPHVTISDPYIGVNTHIGPKPTMFSRPFFVVSKCHHLPSHQTSKMNSPPPRSGSTFAFRGHKSSSSFFESSTKIDESTISSSTILEEWQGWGTTSQVPSMVKEVIDDLKKMEKDLNHEMDFGGLGGKLQGNFKVQEDKKHRAKYQALHDSEEKLQFFSARQIACRLLGSKGYLCQKCWLALEDCMCSKITPSSLWNGIRFWLYMHPKDFLRQNNTGKVLWQTFGVQAAMLCIYGISEHEEIMWNAFQHAGKNKVWCLYPNKNAVTKSVQDIILNPQGSDNTCQPETNGVDEPINFILIDGTWSNSAAMVRRLKERAQLTWGTEEDLPCISLSALGASSMHRLRPQPSWDRTCTAAAAIGLLLELHQLSELSSHGLDTQAELLEHALDALLDALTTRRLRKGRSITRTEKHKGDVC